MSRKISTLSKRFTRYISRKKDRCCDKDIDRKIVIEQIFSLYSEMDKDPLGYLNSDLLKLMGYTSDLARANDNEGLELFLKINRKMWKKDNLDRGRIRALLHEIPLYYLLSLLGYAHYKKELKN
jgi:hypothetical protein